jgi:hypothetical protein
VNPEVKESMVKSHSAATLSMCVITLCCAGVAHADTIAWTNWTSGTSGSPGSASGSIAGGPGITVTYSGQTSGVLIDYPSWNPVSSFTGGTIGNGPAASDNSIQIEGGTNLTETITFTSAIVDPVLAIWSLGEVGDPTSFDFTSGEPFTIEAGGPSAEYGGSSITQSGNDVLGSEGNGVIQFSGTYSQLTFTTPLYENYYTFTVGDDTTATATAVTPEPSTLSLLGIGLAALPLVRGKLRRRRL